MKNISLSLAFILIGLCLFLAPAYAAEPVAPFMQRPPAQTQDLEAAVKGPDKDSALAWQKLGGRYLEMGKRKEAMDALHRALELEPENFSLASYLVSELWDSIPVITILEHAVAGSAAGNDNAWSALSWAYLLSARRPEAENAARKAFDLNPSRYRNAEILIDFFGDTAVVLAALEPKARGPEPALEIWKSLGLAYHASNRVNDAAEAFLRGLHQDPLNLEFATRLFRMGRAAQVVSILEPRMKKDPVSDPAYWSLLANAYHLSGRRSDSIRALRQAAMMDPGNSAYRQQLQELGDLPFLLSWLERQTQTREQRNPNAWEALGSQYLIRGRRKDAIAAFRAAMAIDRDRPSAASGLINAGDAPFLISLFEPLAETSESRSRNILFTLSRAYVAEGRIDDALNTLRKTLSLPGAAGLENQIAQFEAAAQKVRMLETLVAGPLAKSAGAWGELGLGYRSFARRREAIAAYTQALRLEPNNALWSASLLGVMDTPALIAILDRQTKAKGNKDAADAWKTLGDVRQISGQEAPAVKAYARALELDPSQRGIADELIGLGAAGEVIRVLSARVKGTSAENPAIWGSLGRAYLASNRRREAVAALLKAVKLEQSSKEYPVQLSEFGEAGNEVIPVLEDVVSDRASDNAHVWAALGQAYLRVGRRDDALRAYRLSLAAEPGRLTANMQGNLLLMGDAENVIQTLQSELTEKSRELAKLWEFMGDAYRMAGKTADALRAYKSAVETNPGRETARAEATLRAMGVTP